MPSKISAAALFTVSNPVEALITNALSVFPAVIAKLCVWLVSASEAVTVPTLVPLRLFSSSENCVGVTTGANSLTSRQDTEFGPSRLQGITVIRNGHDQVKWWCGLKLQRGRIINR